MNKHKKTVSYVFGAGRLKKLTSGEKIAREFFYGYYFFSENKNVPIIEMKLPNESKNVLLNYIDKILRKLTKLPIYTKDILNIQNFKTLLNTQTLVITTDLLALSLLPYLIIAKLIKSIEIHVIVMGLFGRRPNNFVLRIFQNVYVNLLISITTAFIFLGKGEYDYALERRKKSSQKFHFLPFSIDTDFWMSEDLTTEIQNNDVLFVGNDGKRDFKLLKEIAERMPDVNFTFITSQISNLNLTNVELLKGNWNEQILTDELIKSYYLSSKLTIIPLVDSLQPSGQSVALQSMSCGTPVLITNTDGFWDRDKFIDDENIIFINERDSEEWELVIRSLLKDKKNLDRISKNGKGLIYSEFNLTKFNQKLEKIIGSEV